MSEHGLCDLCGLALGAQVWTLRLPAQELRFCCEGCKGVYLMLHNLKDDGSDGAAPAAGSATSKGEEP